MMPEPSIEQMQEWVKRALKSGADEAEVLAVSTVKKSTTCRNSTLESADYAQQYSVALRLFKDKRQALLSTSDRQQFDCDNATFEQILARAKASPRHATNVLPDQHVGRRLKPIALSASIEPEQNELLEHAMILEQAALDQDGIHNSEGACVSWQKKTITLVTSNGLGVQYQTSENGCMLSVIAKAKANNTMERDYDYRQTIAPLDIPTLRSLGKETALRAVRRLNPRKITSQNMTVVYHPRVAQTLLSHLAMALNGDYHARSTSFLLGKKGTRIMPSHLTVIDDPLRPDGIYSRPCDFEGAESQTRSIIADGVLEHLFLDHRSAVLLNDKTTAHAYRTPDSLPTPKASNLTMQKGLCSPEQLIADVKKGFYVTELLGMSLNINNGDYSRGAAGFLIENGTISFPVAEVTIAGNLNEMFASIIPADDLSICYGIDAPTCAIPNMMVGGR